MESIHPQTIMKHIAIAEDLCERRQPTMSFLVRCHRLMTHTRVAGEHYEYMDEELREYYRSLVEDVRRFINQYRGFLTKYYVNTSFYHPK